MNNQALHLVDINGKKMLNIFDAQNSIDTILGSNTPRPVYTPTVHSEQPDLSQNHIDLDMSGVFIDNNELHTARIFPKKSKVHAHSDISNEYKKFEKITLEIIIKLFSLVLFWSTALFYAVIRALTTFDVMVENYMMERKTNNSLLVKQNEIPEQVSHVTIEQKLEPKIVHMPPKVHVVPVAQYAVQSRPVVITRVPRKVRKVDYVPAYVPQEPAYVPQEVVQESVQMVSKVQTPLMQTQQTVQKVKKRSTTLQVLALVTAEILYGKQLSNIDSI